MSVKEGCTGGYDLQGYKFSCDICGDSPKGECAKEFPTADEMRQGASGDSGLVSRDVPPGPVATRHEAVLVIERADYDTAFDVMARKMVGEVQHRNGVRIEDADPPAIVGQKLIRLGSWLSGEAPILAEAANDLLVAVEMEQHNEALLHGKTGKAWDGDFVRKRLLQAISDVRAALPSAPKAAQTTVLDEVVDAESRRRDGERWDRPPGGVPLFWSHDKREWLPAPSIIKDVKNG